MSGRLVMVYLMCRDLANEEELTTSMQTLFSPCVAFRVVGTPTKYVSNVSEVAFVPNAHSTLGGTNSDRLSFSEYVAIGICSVLLGLIYVASVFLYLHLRKRNRHRSEKERAGLDDDSLGAVEEGIIKSNPLLSISAHFSPPDNVYSDSTSSDTDVGPDVIQHHEDRIKHKQITSALIHPQHQQKRECGRFAPLSLAEYNHQDSTSIERLPEENVSIVETLEGREERPDNLRAINGTTRRKLYFNPAYFEHHLLMSPPPAALEFLAKIREVITIAKQKMATKKYTPSLLGIPEEEHTYALDAGLGFPKRPSSRRNSAISLKRENSRRKTCTGCPGCEPQDFKSLCGKLPEFPALGACQNCCTPSTNDSKQRSIRKWLEDVPVLKSSSSDNSDVPHDHRMQNSGRCPKRLRSPTRSLPPDTQERALSPRPASERATTPDSVKQQRRKSVQCSPRSRKIVKPSTPPPPRPDEAARRAQEETYYDTVPDDDKREVTMNFPPPDMIHEAMVVDNKSEEVIKIPTLTKKQMNAVIQEFNIQRGMVKTEENNERSDNKETVVEYETDSLERSGTQKGYSTPPDYADISSSQPSPSLSTALPMDEEMTMRNAIYNKKTGSMTISKINMEALQEDDHDYELIVLKKGTVIDHRGLYSLPELLQRNSEYSLVSEVYVNNGYNYGSTPSTPTGSNCSTLENRSLKVKYADGWQKPGKLLIEVHDCADNYIPVNDSDEFEPDTLDRKPGKLKLPKSTKDADFIDSLERPNQILLRTTGSFRKESPTPNDSSNLTNGNFNRVFGSLREIYEAKTKGLSRQIGGSRENVSLPPLINNDEEGKLLTLEDRHSKRQRKSAVTNEGNIVQPDVIPPPPHGISPIYEHPKPPRKVILSDDNVTMKPPLPPKNRKRRGVTSSKLSSSNSRTHSVSSSRPGTPASSKSDDSDYEICLVQKSNQNGNIISELIRPPENFFFQNGVTNQFVFHSRHSPGMGFRMPLKSFHSFMSDGAVARDKTSDYKLWHNGIKPEDSGYLSTDSNESHRQKMKLSSGGVVTEPTGALGSETDESLGDGHSESGAESVETHSVFFGTFNRNPISVFNGYGSMDSGVMGEDDGRMSTDSENVSYTTVVSLGDSCDR